MKKEQKKKEHRLTAQCLGIVLIVFALGMFIGYACNYQDVLANFFTGQNTDRTHVVHNSSQMAERGIRVGYYVLGTTENEKYDINFSELKQEENGTYSLEGTFINNGEEHFTTVDLNFSLLDENCNKVGDIYAHCDGLNSKQTWAFKAVGSQQDSAPYWQPTSVILDDVIYTIS